MLDKSLEEIVKAFQHIHQRQNEMANIIIDMHKFLVSLKEERDKERIPERIKALEEAYGEFLMLGGVKNETNKG